MIRPTKNVLPSVGNGGGLAIFLLVFAGLNERLDARTVLLTVPFGAAVGAFDYFLNHRRYTARSGGRGLVIRPVGNGVLLTAMPLFASGIVGILGVELAMISVLAGVLSGTSSYFRERKKDRSTHETDRVRGDAVVE